MTLVLLAIYEVIYYGSLAWSAFIAITFYSARYLGWIGALLSPTIIAAIIVFLDVRWIWNQMQYHPEEGKDADGVFLFGVLCRILLFNGMLVPVSYLGLWRRRIAQGNRS